MQDRLIFLIGSMRSGSTMLARMIGAHSAVHSPAEPHLVTPLAHLGYYAKVEKAAYEPHITQQAMRELVPALPKGEADYLDAMRALTDTLYDRLLEPHRADGRSWLLDKTPAYALVLDFLAKLYPGAKYVVLTRNPMAVWSSFVESFFDGDHESAYRHNPMLERYVPAIGRFLREKPVDFVHVRYEELVQAPEENAQRICDYLGLPFEAGMVDYGDQAGGRTKTARGLGDPIQAGKESRPTTTSLAKWAQELEGAVRQDRPVRRHPRPALRRGPRELGLPAGRPAGRPGGHPARGRRGEARQARHPHARAAPARRRAPEHPPQRAREAGAVSSATPATCCFASPAAACYRWPPWTRSSRKSRRQTAPAWPGRRRPSK